MIERVHDLDDERLVALTDIEIEQLVDIEAAYDGIIPIPDPGPAPQAPSLKPTVKAFKVGDLIFTDQEEAGKVAAMSSLRKVDYDYNGAGYNYQWLDYTGSVGVTPAWFFDRQDVMRLKVELAAHRKAAELHAKKSNEYATYNKAMDDVRSRVWEPILAARERASQIAQAKALYAKHMELAKGDCEIAANFFRNAYKHQPDMIDAVLGNTAAQPE